MKKILLLLLLATFSIQAQTLQNPTYGNVKLKNNTTDNSATKVNVQSTNGTINTISKSDLVNVVEVNDIPSLPLTGEAGKIYVVKNVNKIYRWNGTFYQELTTDISGKENVANKQNSLAVDGTGSKYPTVDAVNAAIPSSIYCWGDSMTFGTGSTSNNDYPNILSKYVNWKTINKGVPGNTSTEIKDRFVAFYTANPEELKKPVIIWAGRNNYPDGGTIKADIATMLSMLPHSNYLVLGVTNSNPGEQIGNSGYTQIVALNNDLKTIYGTNFIDIRSFLVSQYNPSIPQDVIDFGLDLPPSSLLSDNIHLNDLGYRKVASFIANHFSLLEGKRVTYTDAIISRNQYITSVPNSILKTGSDGLVTNSVLYENDLNLGLGFTPNSVSDTQNFEFVNGGNVSSRVAVPQFSLSSNTYGTWYAPKYKTSNFASQILLNGNGGDIVFYTAASGSADADITFLRKFWIKNNGVLEIDNLAGSGDRVISANPSGELIISTAPTAPTAPAGTNTTQIATTAFVQANSLALTGGVVTGNISATLYSGGATLTGTPTAPTAPAGTNTTQIATTAFVNGGLAIKENAFSKNTAFNKNFGTTAGTVVEGGTLGSNAYNSTAYLPLTGGSLTGIVTAPTAPAGTNTTQIATTAFVQATKPYKVYTALLSQTLTNAPVATVLENTLGAVTFTRSSNGVYLVNSSGLFTADKTFVIMGAGTNANYTNAINLINSSVFSIVTKLSSTQSDADSANTKVAFEIRVYN